MLFCKACTFASRPLTWALVAKSVPDPALARDRMLQDASGLDLDVLWTSRGKHMVDANQNDISESIARGWGNKVSR
jgi:hypothetical protein